MTATVMPAIVQPDGEPTLASKAATVAVIGLGVALIEAELIPGMIIGAAAVLAPDLVPKLGRGLRPFIKGMMKAGYSLAQKARETAAEANEHLQDIAAEVKAEQSHPGTPQETPTH